MHKTNEYQKSILLNLIKFSFLTLIPFFDVVVMDQKEIFAEKVRAIMTRNQARDLYDIYYLDDSIADPELINQKLKIYDIEFSRKGLVEAIEKKIIIIRQLSPSATSTAEQISPLYPLFQYPL